MAGIVSKKHSISIVVGVGLVLSIISAAGAEQPQAPANLRLINSSNQAPLAVNDSYSVTAGSELNLPAPGVLANDTDPDGDVLAAILVAGPINGDLTLNSDGSFTYQPDQGFQGSASFTYQASDGQALSSPATVTITVSAAGEWLDTPHGYRLRQSRPRVLLDSKQLAVVIERMYGPKAREPYRTWFNLIKNREDAHQDVDLCNLALIYRATGDLIYKNRFISRYPATGLPTETELYALDLMWNEVADSLKTGVMQRVAAAGNNPWYWASVSQSNATPPYTNVRWGYHYTGGGTRAIAYAGLFAYTELELNKDPAIFPFSANNYLAVVRKELSEDGWFYKTERRIAGDPRYNDALPGSFGGIY